MSADDVPPTTPRGEVANDARMTSAEEHWTIVFAAMRVAAEAGSTDLAEGVARLVAARRTMDDALHNYEALAAHVGQRADVRAERSRKCDPFVRALLAFRLADTPETEAALRAAVPPTMRTAVTPVTADILIALMRAGE